jgi:hypothetical protein
MPGREICRTLTAMPFGPASAEVIVFTLPSCDLTVYALRPFVRAAARMDIVLLDLIVLVRRPDGGTTFVEIDKTPELAAFAETTVARTSCLSMADVVSLGAAVQPGTTGVFVAFESRWSSSLESHIKMAGGHVITHELLPSRTVEAMLPAF